jgi:hypothetical protein
MLTAQNGDNQFASLLVVTYLPSTPPQRTMATATTADFARKPFEARPFRGMNHVIIPDRGVYYLKQVVKSLRIWT